MGELDNSIIQDGMEIEWFDELETFNSDQGKGIEFVTKENIVKELLLFIEKQSITPDYQIIQTKKSQIEQEFLQDTNYSEDTIQLLQHLLTKKLHDSVNPLETIPYLHVLATIFWKQKNYHKSLTLFQEIESIYENHSTNTQKNHVQQGRYEILINIAIVYFHMKEPAQTIELLTQCYNKVTSKWKRLRIIGMLARVYESERQDATAINYYQEQYTLAIELFQPIGHNKAFFALLKRLISILEKHRHYLEAETLCRELVERKGLEELERYLDPTDNCRSTLYSALAKDQLQKRNFCLAEKYILISLEGRKIQLGYDHELTLLTLNTLVIVYLQEQKLDEANVSCRECYRLCEEKFGKENELTIITLSNLYSVISLQGKYEEALPMGLDCLQRRVNLTGEFSEEAIADRYKVASIYAQQGKITEIRNLYTPFINRLRAQYHDSHPLIHQCKNDQEQFLAKALTVSMGVSNLVISFIPKDSVSSSEGTMNPLNSSYISRDVEEKSTIRRSLLEMKDKGREDEERKYEKRGSCCCNCVCC